MVPSHETTKHDDDTRELLVQSPGDNAVNFLARQACFTSPMQDGAGSLGAPISDLCGVSWGRLSFSPQLAAKACAAYFNAERSRLNAPVTLFSVLVRRLTKCTVACFRSCNPCHSFLCAAPLSLRLDLLLFFCASPCWVVRLLSGSHSRLRLRESMCHP